MASFQPHWDSQSHWHSGHGMPPWSIQPFQSLVGSLELCLDCWPWKSKTSNQSMHQNLEHSNRSGRNKRLLKSTNLTKDSLQYAKHFGARSLTEAVLREWAGFNFFRVTCGTGLLLAAGSSTPLGGSGPFTALSYSRLDILHKMTTQFIKTTSVLQQMCFL